MTAFSSRDSLSNLSPSNSDATRQSRNKLHFVLAAPSLSSPLGLPKELPTVTAFSPRDSLSELGSPLGLPKEFKEMEQKLQETYLKEEHGLFYYHPMDDRIVLSRACKIAAIAIIATGYASDMPEV